MPSVPADFLVSICEIYLLTSWTAMGGTWKALCSGILVLQKSFSLSEDEYAAVGFLSMSETERKWELNVSGVKSVGI